MRIAIYDSEHFETTYTLVKAIAASGNQLVLFVTHDVEAVLKEMLSEKEGAAVEWIILQRARIKNPYLLYRHCCKQNIQFLLLNTVSYHHLLFGFLCLLLRKTKSVVTIHDANSFFRPALTFSFRSVAKYLGKKMLAASVHGFTCLLSSTRQFIEENYRPTAPVGVLPGSFFISSTPSSHSMNRPLIIVIPGSVDTRRRDYEPLFELAKHWPPQAKRLEVVLLGAVKDKSGKVILQKLESLSAHNLIFTVSEQRHVQQKEYDRQLQRSDFLYAPLQKAFVEESTIPEQYGLTKSSGCFFDAVRFGKLLLLPSNIDLPTEIVPQVIFHSSTEELRSFLLNLTDAQMSNFNAVAVTNAKRFTRDAISQQLTSFLRNLP